MLDPNPKVQGMGIQRLRDAGIEVDVELMNDQAEAINRGFLKRMRQQKPFVTVKLAASLDGKIALSNGRSKWITGTEARSDVQYHRAQVCAILSSAKTVIMDDASLVVRQNELPRGCSVQRGSEEIRQPLRVVIDIHNELQGNERLFSAPSPIVVVNHSVRAQDLPEHVTILTLDSSAQRVDIDDLLSTLALQHEINHLWVEAGATLAGGLFAAGCVDELILYQAPVLLGDKSQDMLHLPEWKQLSDAIQLTLTSTQTVGNDTKMNFSLTYQPS
jgi:diaminohydroxyphosphoribosylaminopyrimidine deaminase/5-amino-6-(5-phosphoribosylamino)uracil reductase